MIEYKNLKVQDFDFEIDAESITQTGNSIVFPVNIFLKADGEPAFTKGIIVNATFHKQLKATENYKSDLMEILRARVEKEILDKMREDNAVDIHEKVDFIKMKKIPV